MAENNNMQVEQEENQPKRIPYESASESCTPLNSLVPISFAKEQIFFNRTLKVEVGDVDEYLKEKLKYKSVDDLCKAFAREQIDAVATAIYNWEATGNAIIVSDQTGLGKGRIVAGLIRYSILNLREYPVFFTEKKNLFSDIYRDLYDIGLDAAIPIQIKKQAVMVSEEDLTDAVIIREIKKDIAKGELRLDYTLPSDEYDLKDILDDDDLMDDLMELYRQHILENGVIEGKEYEKVVENLSDTQIKNLIKRDIESIGTIRFVEATPTQIQNLFDKSEASFLKKVIDAYQTNLSVKRMTQDAEKENRIRVFPFCPFDVEIKNKVGDILYEVTTTQAKEFVNSNRLDAKYRENGLMLMCYTTLQRGFMSRNGQLEPKGKFVIEKCQNKIIILDEAHNAAGQSNRFRIMTMLLRQAKYVSYVSATWAKRPDNMPIYAVRTAIKDSYLSTPQIVSAFQNGGLALQEAVSSNLVQDGQLVRREKEIEGQPIYYTESDQSDVGLNQISKLNDVASIWQDITFQLEEFYKAFKKVVDRIDVSEEIGAVDAKEAKKRFKIAGKVNTQLFLVFNYFLLGLKVRQAANQAVKELKEGRKVVLAIANTLESAFSNIKKDYLNNERYEIGDRVPNDFSELLKYMASYILQIKYKGTIINDMGEPEEAEIKVNLWDADISKSTGNQNLDMIIRTLQPEWTERMNGIIQRIDDTNIPLSPIDQIKAIIQSEGFTIDEITGRTKMMDFVDGDNYEYGVLAKREKTDKMDIINRFNSNQLDAVIINQSGSTGLSLHAIPTMIQGKIVPPVDVVPNPPIPPTSLLPRNEVKQRSMIILQMELNVSTEIQKLGRINRNGQVFPPKYIYIVSAIPSEARLSAMMQRKLQSLMATTAGSQEFGEDLFSYDDLFSDNAVSCWNETCDEYRLPNDYKVANGADIYNRTKLFYLVNYDLQKNFYFTLANKLRRKIEEMKRLGQYFQAIQYKDYRAVSKQLIPFIIGNNEAISVFGKHTFAELVDVTEIGQKNYASIIKKEIASNTYLLVGGDTQKIADFEKYVQQAEATTQSMIDSYNTGYFEDNTRQKERIEAFQAELNELKKGLSKFGSLEKILGLEKLIEEKEKRKKELAEELPQMVMRGDDTKTISKQLQELAKEVDNNQKELSKIAKGQSASEMQSEKMDLERSIKNAENNIDNAKIRIEKNEKQIANQILYRGYYITFIKSVGKIFNVNILDERLQAVPNEDGSISDYVYEYATNTSEPMVLTAVRFSQNSNFYFTLGEIDLVFHSATESYTFNLSNLYREFGEEEMRRQKKHQYEIKDTDVSYETEWDVMLSQIDTSYTTEKVMLSGDLLRGLAFNSLTNYSGHIVKYSTFENKLKISLEFNKDSTDVVKPRFNEGNNYVILFGLSADNAKRVMPYMLAKQMIVGMQKYNYADYYENTSEVPSIFCVSTQFLYSRDNVFLAFYPSLNLFKKIDSFFTDAKNNLSDVTDLRDSDSDLFKSLVNQIAKIIRDNFDSVRFCISSDAADFLTYFENILYNTGAEAYQYDSDFNYSGVSLLYSSDDAQYALYEATDTKAVQKKRLNTNTSALGVRLDEAQRLTKAYRFYTDGDLYTGVYIVSRDVIQNRAIDTRQSYFNPLYNMSLTYSALDKIINFLQAQNTQIIAATSADPVYAAEPKYLFNIESSTKGLLNDIQIESIETLGNEKIQAIEDVINEFVALYE